VEDILDTGQRPKAEEFDDYIFITFKAVNRRKRDGNGGSLFEQISLIFTENTVITFQEIPGDCFDGIRKRILNNAGRIRKMKADYLAYAIMDAVVDDYFSVLDSLGAGTEEFEERAMDEKDDDFLGDLRDLKQNLLKTRRVIWPLRESLSLLLRMESAIITDELEPFIKDVYDAVIQAAETVETYREHVAGVMEIRLSMMSNRMNGVMKVLTIISTIFIPLTFIVGVYGMNFRFMPELEMRYAYPAIWGLMILIVAGMLIVFKRRHWL
jgi:magnesium transporter